jgi:gas vesicle protein
MAETRSSKALLVPIFAGMLGAGVALLFAPRSGRETREKMRMRAEDMKHQTKEGAAEIRESLDRSIREAQDLKERLSVAMAGTDRKAKQELREDQEERRTPQQSPVLSTWEEEV